MSVKIPQLTFIDTFENYTSSVVNCEGYGAISYFIVTAHDGELFIDASVDGITFYQNTFVNILSSGTVYTDRVNINFKYCRFRINQSLSGQCSLQSFFFLNSDTKITNFIGGTGVTEVAATLPLSSSSPSGPSTTLSISEASTSNSGFLSASNFTTFNSKLSGVNTIAPLLNNGANPVTLTIADSGVTPGSYTYANLTVSNVGLISAASSNTPVTSATAGTGISLSAGTGNITITNTGVTSVSGTSPIVSSGGTTPAISLADSGVTAATYTNATVTVNAKGLITAASNGSGGGNRSFFATGCVLDLGNNGTFYTLINLSLDEGRRATNSTVVADNYIVMPMAGTFKNAYYSQATAWGSGRSRTYALFVNGVATSLTFTITSPATTANNTVNTVSVSAGDLVCWQYVHSGGSYVSIPTRISVEFVAA